MSVNIEIKASEVSTNVFKDYKIESFLIKKNVRSTMERVCKSRFPQGYDDVNMVNIAWCSIVSNVKSLSTKTTELTAENDKLKKRVWELENKVKKRKKRKKMSVIKEEDDNDSDEDKAAIALTSIQNLPPKKRQKRMNQKDAIIELFKENTSQWFTNREIYEKTDVPLSSSSLILLDMIKEKSAVRRQSGNGYEYQLVK